MPSWRDVEEAKKPPAETTERAQGLPPGYISGCSLSVTVNNTIQVGVGIVEVATATVRITEARDPDPDEWEVLRLDDLTYYVYIDKGANLHIDILAPEFRVDLMGDYHSVYTWRYLGRFYIEATGIFGEFSRGTMRKHYNKLLDAVDPNTSVTAVDCSAQVPVGCRTVLLHIDASSSGGAHDVSFYDDSGAAASAMWGHAETNGGNDDWHGQLTVGLDTARKFYYQASNAAIDDLTVELIAYWL